MAARSGFFVFPVAPLGKVPALKDLNWAEIATRDPAALARWWRATPYNVGIVTGSRSGIVVVDLDTSHGDAPPPECSGMSHGLDVLTRLANQAGGDLPATFTVTTPRGQHLYYRPPPGVELRNTQGKIGWLVDTRGGGVVAAVGVSRMASVLIEGPRTANRWAGSSPGFVSFPSPVDVAQITLGGLG